MFNAKDIITIVLLLAILGVLFFIMKSQKTQTSMIAAVGLKTGALESGERAPTRRASKSRNEDEGGYGGEKVTGKDVKKFKPNPIQKKVLELFNDGVPKTTTEIKKQYKLAHGEKEKVNSTDLNNAIWNLEPSGTLMKEKAADDTNYWGLGEWFDDDGYLMGEYSDKVPALAEGDEQA